MKKMMILSLLSMVIGLGNAVAQETPAYEGEISTQMHSVTKMKSQVLTKNILAKMILKKVMKKLKRMVPDLTELIQQQLSLKDIISSRH